MNGTKIEIYFKAWCGYSRRALALLDAKRAEYEIIDVTDDPEREAEMRRRSGRRTVPEIFVDDDLIGGFDDLRALERAGRLDRVLGLTPAHDRLDDAYARRLAA